VTNLFPTTTGFEDWKSQFLKQEMFKKTMKKIKHVQGLANLSSFSLSLISLIGHNKGQDLRMKHGS
jgi:hypothetical protein